MANTRRGFFGWITNLFVPRKRDASQPREPLSDFTSNPAWCVYDLLLRSGWQRDELDIESFQAAAQICDEHEERIALDPKS